MVKWVWWWVGLHIGKGSFWGVCGGNLFFGSFVGCLLGVERGLLFGLG